MGRGSTRIAAGLALLMLAGGAAACIAAVVGFFRFMAELDAGERVYDAMPLVGIFIGGAGGFLIAVMGFAAWVFRRRSSAYVFLLVGLLLTYYPVGIVLSGLRAGTLVEVQPWLTAGGAVLLLCAAVFAGRNRRRAVSDADPRPR